MTYTIVTEPHICGTKPTDVPYGTIIRCDDCGQLWRKEGSALIGLVLWTRLPKALSRAAE